jgi:hypothetical protein
MKPREIFNLLPKGGILDGRLNPPPLMIPMPHGPYGDEPGWGITLLETFLLIALARHENIRSIMEIGTYKGDTTRNLAMNLAADIWTIDWNVSSESSHLEDLPNVHRIVGDSRYLGVVNLPRTVEMVFIDGGHQRDTVERDTELAFRSVPKGVIVWHDCGHPEYPWIQEICESLGATKIESTQLAFLIRAKSRFWRAPSLLF